MIDRKQDNSDSDSDENNSDSSSSSKSSDNETKSLTSSQISSEQEGQISEERITRLKEHIHSNKGNKYREKRLEEIQT